MKRILSMGIAVALMVSAGAATAYPSLMGPTGGANLPTAESATPKKLGFAVDRFKQDYIAATLDTDPAIGLRMIYGVTPKLELGATYCKQDGILSSSAAETNLDTWSLNAKYVTPCTLGGAKWATGASYLKFTESSLDTDAVQFYFVGSKTLLTGKKITPAIYGSVGANWTDLSVLGFDGSAIRPFVGVDLVFAKKLLLSAEYQMKDTDLRDKKAMTSIALSYPFSDEIIGKLLYTNSIRGVVGSDDNTLSLGFSYRFDNMFPGK